MKLKHWSSKNLALRLPLAAASVGTGLASLVAMFGHGELSLVLGGISIATGAAEIALR